MKQITVAQLKDCVSIKELYGEDSLICVIDADNSRYVISECSSTDVPNLLSRDKQLMESIAQFAVQEQTISASAIQRKFKSGMHALATFWTIWKKKDILALQMV